MILQIVIQTINILELWKIFKPRAKKTPVFPLVYIIFRVKKIHFNFPDIFNSQRSSFSSPLFIILIFWVFCDCDYLLVFMLLLPSSSQQGDSTLIHLWFLQHFRPESSAEIIRAELRTACMHCSIKEWDCNWSQPTITFIS